MLSKNKIILIFLFLILFSLNVVAGATNDVLESHTYETNESYISDIGITNIYDEKLGTDIDVNNEGNDKLETEIDEPSHDEIEIWVGSNDNDGNGSYNNPFKNLTLACNNVSGQDKATINIYNGTYYLDSHLKFNTNNLFIRGIGKVIIKNADNNKIPNVDSGKAFGLTSSSANVTMSNITFDATDYSAYFMDQIMQMGSTSMLMKFFFVPFYGDTNLCTFINCSFIGFKQRSTQDKAVLNGLEYNSSFIDCYFDNDIEVFAIVSFDKSGEYGIDIAGVRANTIHTFQNCIFANAPVRIAGKFESNSAIYLDGVWFGKNKITIDIGSEAVGHIFISKYANFTVFEKYNGNNNYEIIGKLTWNGTNDQKGMENFQPMTVKLISDKGEIISTATLVNGSFSTNYTSTSTITELTVELDKQQIDLKFMSVDVSVYSPSIYYGEDQNVTINFTDKIIANITVTVYNDNYREEYPVEVNNKSSIVYKIPGKLKEGIYTIDVNVNDNHQYGFNSTVLEVSKVSNFSLTPSYPEDSKVGDTVPVTVVFYDATGNVIEDIDGDVTIYVGIAKIPFSGKVSANTVINITGLVYGNNPITVVYSGDDKYVSKSSDVLYIPVDKVSDYNLTINLPEQNSVGDDVRVTVKLPIDVVGEVTLIIDGEKHILPLNNGVAEHTINNIRSGNHVINAIYMGDSKYEMNYNTTTFVVDKIPTTLNVESISINTDQTAVVNITLSEILNTDIYVELDGKKQIITLEKGKGQLIASNLKEGSHVIKARYNGDEIYQASTNNTATITVTKIAANLKANTSNITVGDNATISIEINKKATGSIKVILDKDYPVTITDGKGNIIIQDLSNGTYTALIVFEGDDVFKQENTTVTFKVSKADIKDQVNITTNIPEGTTAPEFSVNLPTDATGEFNVTVDGNKTYNATLVNGSATVKVPELTVGNHTIITSYSGDKKYDGFTNSTTLNVPKATIPGGENALNMTTPVDSATPSFSINLPGATGNLTVIVDGKDNYTKGLVNGSATVSVPELPSGKHNIQVSYSGDEKFSSISKNITVNVPEKTKPATPDKQAKVATKITAKNKKFKANKKVKKYTITLKAKGKPVKKVQVIIKIGKKTYKAKTNAKGKATFKIKKLTKKGKYKAVIKFKGNKNYKPSSKKVKLTIK